jgi:hypothetical protein
MFYGIEINPLIPPLPGNFWIGHVPLLGPNNFVDCGETIKDGERDIVERH